MANLLNFEFSMNTSENGSLPRPSLGQMSPPILMEETQSPEIGAVVDNNDEVLNDSFATTENESEDEDEDHFFGPVNAVKLRKTTYIEYLGEDGNTVASSTDVKIRDVHCPSPSKIQSTKECQTSPVGFAKEQKHSMSSKHKVATKPKPLCFDSPKSKSKVVRRLSDLAEHAFLESNPDTQPENDSLANVLFATQQDDPADMFLGKKKSGKMKTAARQKPSLKRKISSSSIDDNPFCDDITPIRSSKKPKTSTAKKDRHISFENDGPNASVAPKVDNPSAIFDDIAQAPNFEDSSTSSKGTADNNPLTEQPVRPIQTSKTLNSLLDLPDSCPPPPDYSTKGIDVSSSPGHGRRRSPRKQPSVDVYDVSAEREHEEKVQLPSKKKTKQTTSPKQPTKDTANCDLVDDSSRDSKSVDEHPKVALKAKSTKGRKKAISVTSDEGGEQTAEEHAGTRELSDSNKLPDSKTKSKARKGKTPSASKEETAAKKAIPNKSRNTRSLSTAVPVDESSCDSTNTVERGLNSKAPKEKAGKRARKTTAEVAPLEKTAPSVPATTRRKTAKSKEPAASVDETPRSLSPGSPPKKGNKRSAKAKTNAADKKGDVVAEECSPPQENKAPVAKGRQTTKRAAKSVRPLSPASLNGIDPVDALLAESSTPPIANAAAQLSAKDRKKLFANYAFIITATGSEAKPGASQEGRPLQRKVIVKQITQHGGMVVESLKETSLYPSRMPVVISDAPQLTEKYLVALASGINCVSHLWVLDSVEQGKLLNARNYDLPAGVSPITNETVEAQFNGSPLKDLRFLVIGASEAFRSNWSSILTGSGAILSSRQSNSAIQSVDVDYILVEKHKSLASRLDVAKKWHGDKVVSREFIIGCLVHNRRLNVEENRPVFSVKL